MTRDSFRDWLLSVIRRELSEKFTDEYYAELHKSPILYDNSSVIEVSMGTDRFIIKIDSFAKYVGGRRSF